MARKNNLSNFQETIADPESRMALKEEYLNNMIESFNSQDSQLTGIVLYAEQKTTESSEVVTAIRVRAKGIHDKYLPDPIAVAEDKETNTNKFINSCLECHPVVFPQKTQTLGEENTELYFSATQGDVVELTKNQQGVLMYGRKISKSVPHSTMLYNFTPGKADQPGMFVDSASSAFKNSTKQLVFNINDLGEAPAGKKLTSGAVTKDYQLVGAVLPIDMQAARVTSRMGPRKDPVNPVNEGEHKGIDIGAAKGTPLYAMYDGVVKEAAGTTIGGRIIKGFGAWVVLKHSNVKDKAGNSHTIYVVYGHVDGSYVKSGDRVVQGQAIAAVGDEGRGTGAHLHLEVHKGWYRKPYVDPIDTFGWDI